jgi:hypothetical protein
VIGSRRKRSAAAFAAALMSGGAFAAVSSARETSVPTLIGIVGPGATISLRKSGKLVTTLKAGSYHLEVRDRSKKENFHMVGRGINLFTPVRKTGTFGWSLTILKGTYRYYSDPHRKTLTRSFRAV